MDTTLVKTNFFTTICSLIDGVDLKMVIKKKDDQLIISTLPIARVDDAAGLKIPDITLRATPEEFDQHFFEQITTPLKKVSTWSVDLKAYEEKLAEVEAQTKRASQQKERQSKEERQINEKLQKAQKHSEKDLQHKKALQLVTEVLKQQPQNEKAKKLESEIRSRITAGTLFDQSTGHSL